jgi:hypothetical protein
MIILEQIRLRQMAPTSLWECHGKELIYQGSLHILPQLDQIDCIAFLALYQVMIQSLLYRAEVDKYAKQYYYPS